MRRGQFGSLPDGEAPLSRPRVIARVNNPRNQWLYTKAWGVDVAISQVHLTAKVIEEEIGLGELSEVGVAVR